MLRRRKLPNSLSILLGDIAAVLLANLLALALRFDFDWSVMVAASVRTRELILVDLLLTPLAFAAAGLYRGSWRYAGLNDLMRLVPAIGYRTVGIIVVLFLLGIGDVSRAVLVLSAGLLMAGAGMVRLGPRVRLEIRNLRGGGRGRRALIYGAGDTGELLLRDLRQRARDEFNIVGFIDDDPAKVGGRIHGVPILGGRLDLQRLIARLGIGELIVALPGSGAGFVRGIFEICERDGVRVRTVPTCGELERGTARVTQIRPVQIEDLLGRDVVSLNREILYRGLGGKRVLVTGAAGSIGRELAIQIAACRPARLTLVDRNENNLFYLENDLRRDFPLLALDAVIGDILNRERMSSLFQDVAPHLVFHAAAFKHVPLMERHPEEAVLNNVVGTRGLAEIAMQSGVERFTYISTDKAVRPSCVMGATKRLGERLVKSLSGGGRCRYMTVRFGNVLGSDGSVIPTFKRQIAQGGPVTVTHPEATRFFMTIAEAVELVLIAGAIGEGGETFLLRMGDPVRILDLARNTIQLSGLKPDEEIPIVFTGLRPGEKLHEELVGEGETALPTAVEKILALGGVVPLSDEDWGLMEDLPIAARRGDRPGTLAILRALVPDYRPVASPPSVPEVAPAVTVAPGELLEART